MPELPEVETIVRELKNKIINKKIKNIEIKSEKSFSGNKKKILAKKINKIWRRAKIIIFQIDDINLAIHLKMTGQLIFQKKSEIGSDRFCRVIINFSNGDRLLFNDLRKFGWLKIINSQEMRKLVKSFGIEPFAKDFTKENFWQSIFKRKLAIKSALIDQTKIAGIGNIYANEALFCADIIPKRPANKIGRVESDKLFDCVLKILKSAIKSKGTSAENYVRTNGSLGQYDQKLLVYGRADEKCPKCKSKIKKIKIGGRGTYFCPKCQK